jgi:hypothetical protein
MITISYPFPAPDFWGMEVGKGFSVIFNDSQSQPLLRCQRSPQIDSKAITLMA